MEVFVQVKDSNQLIYEFIGYTPWLFLRNKKHFRYNSWSDSRGKTQIDAIFTWQKITFNKLEFS